MGTRAVALDARLVAQGFVQSLAERQPHVLDRVVRVDMQVALGLDLKGQPPVAGDLLEHVVEKAHPGAHGRTARFVEPDRDLHVRLAGLAFDGGLALGHGPLPGAALLRARK